MTRESVTINSMVAVGEQWFLYLDHEMQDLVKQSYTLLDRFRKEQGNDRFHDYSFIVFPMAKAYEGFLKKWFFDNGLIDEEAYRSDHFRIGKALNPSLPERYRRNWYVYTQIVARCSDPSLGDRLWRAWKDGRNRTFHYFPHHERFLTLGQAKERIDRLADAMRYAVNCRVSHV